MSFPRRTCGHAENPLPEPLKAESTAGMSHPLQEDQRFAGLPTSCAGSVFGLPALACSRASRAQPSTTNWYVRNCLLTGRFEDVTKATRMALTGHGGTAHSITSSARASKEGGTVRPSALAVFMLITSWNLVGCSTGRSEGLAPLRILSA
jgi:hypothetical protein